PRPGTSTSRCGAVSITSNAATPKWSTMQSASWRSDLSDVAGVGRERRAASLRVVADLGPLGRRGPGLEGVLTVPEQFGDEVRRAALRVTELEAVQPGRGLDEGDVLVGVAAVKGLFVGRLVIYHGQSVHRQLPPCSGCRISPGRWGGWCRALC